MAVYRDDNIQEHVHDRTPPQNVDLEMCVLGAIMLGSGLVYFGALWAAGLNLRAFVRR